MATPTLPLNMDLSLRSFTDLEIAAMAIKRDGVKGEGDHVTYNFGPDGAGCTRKFFCAYDERFNAAIYFAGAAKTYVDSGDTKLSRLLPQRDPDYPNWAVSKVEISPWRFMGEIEEPDDDDDIAEQQPVFDRGKLRVTYEMVPWDLVTDDDRTAETDRYVTWPGYVGAEVSTQADYIGLPGSVLNYATDDGTTAPAGVPIPYPVGFTEAKSKFKVVWRRVPFEAWGPSTTLTQRVLGTVADRGYVGSVNKTTFRGYPALSLLLTGVEQRLLPDATGLGFAWDIGYEMHHKPQPEGHLGLYYHSLVGGAGYYQALRPAAGQTTIAVASLGDTDALFPVREFADLFVVGDV